MLESSFRAARSALAGLPARSVEQAGLLSHRKEKAVEEKKMAGEMRIMTENHLNAETPVVYLRSWITANTVFFDLNAPATDVPCSRKWQRGIPGPFEESATPYGEAYG